jgi:hypothetical protein
VLVNGVNVGDCVIPAGARNGRLVDIGQFLDKDDDVQVQIANIGFSVVLVLRFS